MSESADAHDALHDAIRRVFHLDCSDDEKADMLLSDWVVTYAAVSAKDSSVTIYGGCYPQGTAVTYRALGLLDITRDRLLNTGWEHTADDG